MFPVLLVTHLLITSPKDVTAIAKSITTTITIITVNLLILYSFLLE